jgi:gas vesicle protein
MTFAGKILVIVIMCMSLIFLGVSTVALTTAKDWGKETREQKKANDEINEQLTKVIADRDAFKAKLELAQKEHQGATRPVDDQISRLKAEDKQGRDAITKADETLITHEADTKNTLEDVQNKNTDIIKLRGEVDAVTVQAAKFKTRQEEFDSEIANLQRMLEAARTNSAQINKSH